MKKYKKIIIVALCFALLLSMYTVSAFATEETSVTDSSVTTVDDPVVLYVYYVPSGWTFDDFLLSDVYGSICSFSISSYDLDFRLVSVVDNVLSLESFSSEVVTLSSEYDFFMGSLSEIPVFSEYQIDPSILTSSFYFDEGWEVPAGFFYDPDFLSSFILDGIQYADSSIAFGYTYNGDFVGQSDTLVISNNFLDNPLILQNTESFILQFNADLFTSSFHAAYFLLHNGEVFVPSPASESLTNDLFTTFGSVGTWISGAASSLVPMFWDGSSLTFVGLLSVSALAISVVFLLLSFIERFLRFGG